MHPIERLRFVARDTGAPSDEVVRGAASSLAGFASDPASLLTACRRLIDRHAANGPVWWVCARTLSARLVRMIGTRDTAEVDYATRTLVFAARQAQPSALGRWPTRPRCCSSSPTSTSAPGWPRP